MTSAQERRHGWLSRRTVVRALGWLCAAPGPFLLGSMLHRHGRLSADPKRLEIPAPAGDGVALTDEVIVCRAAGTTRVFSARCTHMGCRITAATSDLLVCPCHGSRFRFDGSVATGPAARPLEPLPFAIDARTGALIVHVS